MPTYLFVCDCGYRKEEYLQISKRNTVTICSCCGKKMVRSISTGGGFNFKGKGFYETDYKTRKEPK